MKKKLNTGAFKLDEKGDEEMKAVFFDLFETLITERENGRNTVDFGTPECNSPATHLGLSEETFEKEWVARRPGRMKGNFRIATQY